MVNDSIKFRADNDWENVIMNEKYPAAYCIAKI
jgi:hypothetical protein